MPPRSALRIKGVVRAATRVRELAGDLREPQDVTRLRAMIDQNVEVIQSILRLRGATVEDLPGPSRNAARYLFQLDVDQLAAHVPPAPAPPAAPAPQPTGTPDLFGDLPPAPLELPPAPPPSRGPIRITGISRDVEDISRYCNELIRGQCEFTLERITQIAIDAAEHNDALLLEGDAERLTPKTRASRGWIAFMARKENMQQMVRAMKSLRSVLANVSNPDMAAAQLHFRNTAALYRVRQRANTVIMTVPTEMISFGDADMQAIGRLMDGDPLAKSDVAAAMHREAYLAITRELSALGGHQENAAGVHHDLHAAFARVDQQYFHGSLVRPLMEWGTNFASRTMGLYRLSEDRITINPGLDRADVPEFVIDFLVYHEALHKQYGLGWSGTRAVHHPRAFRDSERKFKRFAEAEAFLAQFSKAMLTGRVLDQPQDNAITLATPKPDKMKNKNRKRKRRRSR